MNDSTNLERSIETEKTQIPAKSKIEDLLSKFPDRQFVGYTTFDNGNINFIILEDEGSVLPPRLSRIATTYISLIEGNIQFDIMIKDSEIEKAPQIVRNVTKDLSEDALTNADLIINEDRFSYASNIFSGALREHTNQTKDESLKRIVNESREEIEELQFPRRGITYFQSSDESFARIFERYLKKGNIGAIRAALLEDGSLIYSDDDQLTHVAFLDVSDNILAFAKTIEGFDKCVILINDIKDDFHTDKESMTKRIDEFLNALKGSMSNEVYHEIEIDILDT